MRATVIEAQSDHALQARKLIEESEGVLEVSTHGNSLRVLVDRPDRQVSLQALWNTSGLAVENARVVKPRLEDAFVLLLKGEKSG